MSLFLLMPLEHANPPFRRYTIVRGEKKMWRKEGEMVEDGLEILPTTVGYDMMENAFLSWLRGGRRKRERTEGKCYIRR